MCFMKTVVHVISHSHWDREWYLPFETHRRRLLTLMDECMKAFEEEKGYEKFHLDGQTIVLEDYLEIYPDRKDELTEYIRKGNFQIGPWYVLQDEFLTSGEANVRNLLYGIEDAKKYGSVCKTGYFPDAFGNVGQMPQILKQAGMEAVAFGRGVRPVGFNNQVEGNDYLSAFSELTWKSPDGSELLGILFANWYNNGSEIPVEETAAKEYWDRKLKDAGKFAATEHLLLMNGSDHQPIQKNLPEALETAGKLYPDVVFLHSDFPTYIECVKKSLDSELSVVTGELTSQETDGYNTLVNTASSRNYLKAANRKNKVLLEKMAEPVSVMAMREGMDYPHDSICGCSIDAVHREMETRFEKSLEVSEQIVEDAKEFMASEIDTSFFGKYGKSAIPFVVWNTVGWNRTETTEVTLDLYKDDKDDLTQDYRELENFPLDEWRLINHKGKEIPCEIKDQGVQFGYILPEDAFRKRYMSRQVTVSFQTEIEAMGYRTFALVPGKKIAFEKESLITGQNRIQ